MRKLPYRLLAIQAPAWLSAVLAAVLMLSATCALAEDRENCFHTASVKYQLDPWLMASVGRRTEHAGQTTITLTGLHAHFSKARAALMRTSALLKQSANTAAEQFNPQAVWLLLCRHIKLLLALPDPPNPPRLPAFPAQGIA